MHRTEGSALTALSTHWYFVPVGTVSPEVKLHLLYGKPASICLKDIARLVESASREPWVSDSWSSFFIGSAFISRPSTSRQPAFEMRLQRNFNTSSLPQLWSYSAKRMLGSSWLDCEPYCQTDSPMRWLCNRRACLPIGHIDWTDSASWHSSFALQWLLHGRCQRRKSGRAFVFKCPCSDGNKKKRIAETTKIQWHCSGQWMPFLCSCGWHLWWSQQWLQQSDHSDHCWGTSKPHCRCYHLRCSLS